MFAALCFVSEPRSRSPRIAMGHTSAKEGASTEFRKDVARRISSIRLVCSVVGSTRVSISCQAAKGGTSRTDFCLQLRAKSPFFRTVVNRTDVQTRRKTDRPAHPKEYAFYKTPAPAPRLIQAKTKEDMIYKNGHWNEDAGPPQTNSGKTKQM